MTGDWICQLWGIEHTHYRIAFGSGLPGFHLDIITFAKVALAGIAFGVMSLLFAEASHSAQSLFKKLLPYAPLRPVLGGLRIIGLVYAVGSLRIQETAISRRIRDLEDEMLADYPSGKPDRWD